MPNKGMLFNPTKDRVMFFFLVLKQLYNFEYQIDQQSLESFFVFGLLKQPKRNEFLIVKKKLKGPRQSTTLLNYLIFKLDSKKYVKPINLDIFKL